MKWKANPQGVKGCCSRLRVFDGVASSHTEHGWSFFRMDVPCNGSSDRLSSSSYCFYASMEKSKCNRSHSWNNHRLCSGNYHMAVCHKNTIWQGKPGYNWKKCTNACWKPCLYTNWRSCSCYLQHVVASEL
ncbi:hypothetical protein V8G54_015383 [Vigna mungo]|uniref:Uncharacterized protein n=1 Tax=Vigna mungo TaxID=3915 RepID=A0AAQ3NM89_VIGMU